MRKLKQKNQLAANQANSLPLMTLKSNNDDIKFVTKEKG